MRIVRQLTALKIRQFRRFSEYSGVFGPGLPVVMTNKTVKYNAEHDKGILTAAAACFVSGIVVDQFIVD
jgi:hypothetical protein